MRAGLTRLQSGRCAICGDPPGKRGLHLDHDHLTGIVRGLLCHRCNFGIGLFRDSEELLMRAITYLGRSGFSDYDMLAACIDLMDQVERESGVRAPRKLRERG